MDSPSSEANGSPPASLVGIPRDIFCERCDYNLRALTIERCPECGESFDAASLLGSQIPWEHRDRLGLFRAYWKTVRMVMFRHARFCRQTVHPVDFAAAQLFRWVTILHVYVPLLAMTAAAYALYPPRPLPEVSYQWLWAKAAGNSGLSVLDWIYMEPWLMALAHVCVVLWLVAITGVHTYFFHPRHVDAVTQDRTNALSYYLCAPLALMPAPLALVAYAVHSSKSLGGPVAFQAGYLLAALVMAWFCAFAAVMLSRVFSADAARCWGTAICLVLLWSVLGLFVFAAVGGTVVAIAVVIASLW